MNRRYNQGQNEDYTENLIIEDQPEVIRFDLVLKKMGQYWKPGVLIVLIFVLLSLTITPARGFSGYKADATLYTPASTRRKVGDRMYVISNNLSQLSNMIELIQSKVYRDAISQEAGIDDLRKIGSFSVDRVKDTDLISVTTFASSKENAEKLCNAVISVMTEQVGKKVSINDMVSVDSVKSYSVTTPSVFLSSVARGFTAGVVVWLLFIFIMNLGDRKFHSAEEVEGDLEISVIAVVPPSE